MADDKPEGAAPDSRGAASQVPKVDKAPARRRRPPTAMEETREAMRTARTAPPSPEPVKTIRPKDRREELSPKGAPTPEEIQDANDSALRAKKQARQRALRGL